MSASWSHRARRLRQPYTHAMGGGIRGLGSHHRVVRWTLTFCAKAPYDAAANAGIGGPNPTSRVSSERGSEKISAWVEVSTHAFPTHRHDPRTGVVMSEVCGPDCCRNGIRLLPRGVSCRGDRRPAAAIEDAWSASPYFSRKAWARLMVMSRRASLTGSFLQMRTSEAGSMSPASTRAPTNSRSFPSPRTSFAAHRS